VKPHCFFVGRRVDGYFRGGEIIIMIQSVEIADGVQVDKSAYLVGKWMGVFFFLTKNQVGGETQHEQQESFFHIVWRLIANIVKHPKIGHFGMSPTKNLTEINKLICFRENGR